MKRDLLYLMRYARLANTESGRARFLGAIAWAREALASRLAGYDQSWLVGYESAVLLDTIHYNAEYACAVAYIKLFEVADRIYFALSCAAAFEVHGKREIRGMRADIYRVLRNVTVQIGGGDVDERVS